MKAYGPIKVYMDDDIAQHIDVINEIIYTTALQYLSDDIALGILLVQKDIIDLPI